MQDQTVPQTEVTKPDPWLTLADDLRQAAARVATLAGTPDLPGLGGATLNLGYSYMEKDAEKAVPILDLIAAAFDATAETKTEGRGQTRRTMRAFRASLGRVTVRSSATLPNPPTRHQTRAALEAELEQLRAQLANGGAAR